MDAPKTHLRRRWDGTPHHPELSGYPHHSHVEREDNVVPSKPMTMLQFLEELERLV